MRRVVIDASVLAAITFGEPDADRCGRMLDGAQLHAPSLLQYEMANAARKKCRDAPRKSSDLATALSLALDPRRGIRYYDPNPVDVLLLANATGLSPYDASYLWLAGFLGADLITLDKQLAAAHDAMAIA
jgi:predicted nucleic acid-binding protein